MVTKTKYNQNPTIKLERKIKTRLIDMGKKGDTFSQIIERLLDEHEQNNKVKPQ